jgi:hypothetical protein
VRLPEKSPKALEVERTGRDETSRDKQLERLKILSEKQKDELRARENAIRRMKAGTPRRADPLLLAKLDTEVVHMEQDILEQETILAVRKKRLLTHAFLPNDAEVERLIAADSRVTTLSNEKQRHERELATKKLTKEKTPAIVELQKTVDGLEKELDHLRAHVKREVLLFLKKQDEELLRKRVDETQDTLEIKRALLAELSKKQEQLQKATAEVAQLEEEERTLRQNLEPLRAGLAKVEAARIQLQIEREVPEFPSSNNATLEAIFKELQVVRRDVKELREQKKP